MGREARLNAHLNPIERQERNIIRILKSAGTAEELDRMVSAIARLGLSEDYVQAVAEQHVRLKPSWVRQREQHEVYTRVDEIRRRKRGEGGGLTAALDAGKAEAIHEALEDTEDIPVLGVEPRPYVAGGEVDVITTEELADVSR